MMEGGAARLKVVSGRRGALRECRVLLDGREAGAVGEELTVPPGPVTVRVSYPPYTCNALPVHVPAGGRVVLDYNTRLLAYVGLVALLPAPVVALAGVGWVLDRVPVGVGLGGLLAALVLAFALAQAAVGAPLRVLGWCGFRTHRLRLVRVVPGDRSTRS
jgi:hypothetical protein